jgi:hypothetical protein
MKALLISVATLVVFDAAAWHGALRTALIGQAFAFAATIGGLDWSWA